MLELASQFQVEMLSTVAVDDAIRTLSVEMSKDKDVSFIGKTEAEKDILAHYAEKGQRRATMGAIVGSSIMAGLWKISKNQKRLAGAFAMMCRWQTYRIFFIVWIVLRTKRLFHDAGGLFGASYGIISIRRSLFSDLLMLSSDKSPFAARARTILMNKIPDNPFVQELNKKFNSSTDATDSWKDDINAQDSFGSTPSVASFPSAPRHLDNRVFSSIPPILGLDTPRNKEDSSDEDFGGSNNSVSRSPFVFGAKPLTDDASDFEDHITPLSHAPFAHSSRESRRSEPDKESAPLRHDEDEYFFEVEACDSDTSVNPTTWEEIRRRAAERRK